jgi:hypothetical protein
MRVIFSSENRSTFESPSPLPSPGVPGEGVSFLPTFAIFRFPFNILLTGKKREKS